MNTRFDSGISNFAVLILIAILAATVITSAVAGSTIYWGAETNGVRFGFWLRISENNETVEFIPQMDNSKTNNGNFRPSVLRLWLPPLPNRYKIDLYDAQGQAVFKKDAARHFNEKLKPDIFDIVDQKHGYFGIFLIRGEPETVYQDHPLFLSDYFDITNSGRYRLVLQPGVIWLQGQPHGDQPLLLLPPASAEVQINVQKK